MKIAVVAEETRCRKYEPKMEIVDQVEKIYFPVTTSAEDFLRKASDVDVLVADSSFHVTKEMMEKMPNLKMIHSEGVAYHGFDLAGARELGIDVCNNKGANADAVAEQAIMLMLMCQRDAIRAHHSLPEGKQIETKERKIVEGIVDLGDCKVGLIGFGDIAKATAKRLQAFGCDLYYYSKHRKSPEVEAEYQVKYLPLYELAKTCHVISLHAAVTPETTGMIDADFIAHMRKDSWLINTARGQLVVDQALREALIQGRIAGAGFDTLYPEPTPGDHPLVDIPKDIPSTVVYSPHLGGNTIGSFRRVYQNIWQNIDKVRAGKSPEYIVNRG